VKSPRQDDTHVVLSGFPLQQITGISNHADGVLSRLALRQISHTVQLIDESRQNINQPVVLPHALPEPVPLLLVALECAKPGVGQGPTPGKRCCSIKRAKGRKPLSFQLLPITIHRSSRDMKYPPSAVMI